MPEKITQAYHNINVHEVNGVVTVIEYLKNTDYRFVEGLFYFAKRYGKAEFYYKGHDYELVRNRNITFTVVQKQDDAEALARAFE